MRYLTRTIPPPRPPPLIFHRRLHPMSPLRRHVVLPPDTSRRVSPEPSDRKHLLGGRTPVGKEYNTRPDRRIARALALLPVYRAGEGFVAESRLVFTEPPSPWPSHAPPSTRTLSIVWPCRTSHPVLHDLRNPHMLLSRRKPEHLDLSPLFLGELVVQNLRAASARGVHRGRKGSRGRGISPGGGARGGQDARSDAPHRQRHASATTLCGG